MLWRHTQMISRIAKLHREICPAVIVILSLFTNINIFIPSASGPLQQAMRKRVTIPLSHGRQAVVPQIKRFLKGNCQKNRPHLDKTRYQVAVSFLSPSKPQEETTLRRLVSGVRVSSFKEEPPTPLRC